MVDSKGNDPQRLRYSLPLQKHSPRVKRKLRGMKRIEDIPSNQLVTMIGIWHRAFKAVGCTPGCHSCSCWITPGHKFKLASGIQVPIVANPHSLQKAVNDFENNETREVMLCENCTPEMYNENELKRLKGELESWNKLSKGQQARIGCFRVNGKIVH